jgi:hypothetical protein
VIGKLAVDRALLCELGSLRSKLGVVFSQFDFFLLGCARVRGRELHIYSGLNARGRASLA